MLHVLVSRIKNMTLQNNEEKKKRMLAITISAICNLRLEVISLSIR